jgi:hypothetical protein
MVGTLSDPTVIRGSHDTPARRLHDAEMALFDTTAARTQKG